MIGIRVTLAGFSGNEETKKDVVFYDKMQEAMDECEKPCLFFRLRNLLMTTCRNAKQAVRRKIKKKC